MSCKYGITVIIDFQEGKYEITVTIVFREAAQTKVILIFPQLK